MEGEELEFGSYEVLLVVLQVVTTELLVPI